MATSATLQPESLPPYQYAPLANPSTDIRLMTLHPGQPDDPIRISIHHTTLNELPKTKRRRMSLEEIRARLPTGWSAYETLEGRFFFFPDNSRTAGFKPQWEWPDSSMEKSAYWQNDDDIACFEPHYEALSYVWGPSQEEATILVENPIRTHEGSLTTFHVRKTLFSALIKLRDKDSARILWIDSICINQVDDAEKSHQVQRMGSIYRGAYRVVAWLGPGTESSGHALGILKYLGRHIEFVKGGRCRSPDATAEEDFSSPEANIPLSPEDLQHLDRFSSREWFTRLWTLQEIQLANTRAIFQCGDETIPLFLLRRAAKILQINLALPATADMILMGVAVESVQDIPFYVLARGIRDCADPRDQVYGLLGLLPPLFASRIEPSYSIDAAEVYKSMTLAHILCTLRLEQMDTAQNDSDISVFNGPFTSSASRISPPTPRPSVPSWVPDLTAERRVGSACWRTFPAGQSRCHVEYRAPNILRVEGVQRARVMTVSQPMTVESYEGGSSSDILRSWYHDGQPEDMRLPVGVTMLEAFALSIIGLQLRERVLEQSLSRPTMSDWLAICANLVNDTLLSPRRLEGLSEAHMYHVQNACQICMDQTFVRTQEGYIGVAPRNVLPGKHSQVPYSTVVIKRLKHERFQAAKGASADISLFIYDLVCVLLGCDRLVVLREVATDHYQVVGPCFLYGLHDAIGLLGPLPSPWVCKLEPGRGYRAQQVFHNETTGEYTYDDPRLAKSDLGDWGRVDHVPVADDPEIFAYFRNKVTGEIMNSDPRLLPDALRARGVDLRTFTLI
jgi:hypothetical protein